MIPIEKFRVEWEIHGYGENVYGKECQDNEVNGIPFTVNLLHELHSWISTVNNQTQILNYTHLTTNDRIDGIATMIVNYYGILVGTLLEAE